LFIYILSIMAFEKWNGLHIIESYNRSVLEGVAISHSSGSE